MRLSDKLQDFLVNGPNMWGPQYETIQQAYRLAKRYEDAPVVELTECNQIEGATDFDWGDMQAAIGPMKPGQRVRIVLDKEG